MKKVIRMGVASVALAGMCMGCGKAESPAPDSAKENAHAEHWEPESVDLPEGHSMDDGHDHSGHNH